MKSVGFFSRAYDTTGDRIDSTGDGLCGGEGLGSGPRDGAGDRACEAVNVAGRSVCDGAGNGVDGTRGRRRYRAGDGTVAGPLVCDVVLCPVRTVPPAQPWGPVWVWVPAFDGVVHRRLLSWYPAIGEDGWNESARLTSELISVTCPRATMLSSWPRTLYCLSYWDRRGLSRKR